ncbi:MAG: sigma-54-dependent Fis family transcriptional regulator [Planctomycetes bacterium]|nr:sigma-54-dependent Fis family transcriptional regulator [Planctomycetota bacterium]
MSPRRLLLVEDDATLRRVLARELAAFGFAVAAYPSAEEALAALGDAQPEVALVDLRLPGMDGLTLLQRLRATDPDLQVVVLTGHGAVPDAVQAMRLGAHDFVTKPTSLEVIEQTLRRALETRALVLDNRRWRRLAASEEDPAGILGESPAIQELRGLVERVAGSDTNVLIQGENGTGKELVARSIHLRSARRDGPFVVLNCGAIPEALLESELFGHERGAFTGADKRRLGLFEASDGGTLFLDEIGELPVAVQPALLRALQFREIRPVGSDRLRTVDVRLVAATNRDLHAEIAAGRFREDLYYRIAALTLEVPPLRARRGDVPILAAAILARVCLASGRRIELAPDAVAALQQHEWPGNVRELENALTRLCVFAPGDTIHAAEVERLVVQRARRTAPGSLPTLDLEELERLAVLESLRRHGGDKKAAAAELGVSLKTLYNKLARYGAPPS